MCHKQPKKMTSGVLHGITFILMYYPCHHHRSISITLRPGSLPGSWLFENRHPLVLRWPRCWQHKASFRGTNRSYFVWNGLDQPYLTNFIPILYIYTILIYFLIFVCIQYFKCMYIIVYWFWYTVTDWGFWMNHSESILFPRPGRMWRCVSNHVVALSTKIDIANKHWRCKESKNGQPVHEHWTKRTIPVMFVGVYCL